MKLLYFVLICLVAISHNANSSNTEYLSETQKEPVFEGGEQRKLQEEKNYIIIYYNGETKYTSFLNERRYNISKIVLGSEDKGPQESFTISSSSGLEVHFNEVIKSLDYFFSKDYDSNAINIISVDFSNFNWSNLNRMDYLFKGCSSLASIDFSNYDLSKVIDMKNAFYFCSSLKSVTLPKNLSSVEEMEYMFSECTSLVSIDLSNIDLPKVTNMKYMFSRCSKLEIVIFPETTQNLPDTSNMFQSCTALKSIDFSNADLSKVTSMDFMFKGCTLLESVTFPENLQNLVTIKYAFSSCTSLKSIDFSNCNLTKLTYLNFMFESCTSLESVSFPESLTNVVIMQNLFQGCSSLQSIDLSNINLSKTGNFECMFQSCSKLESVIFPRSGPQSTSTMTKIMKDCSSLTSIDLSMFTLSKGTILNSFIDGCDSLVAIDFPIFDIKSSEIYDIFFYSPDPIFHFKYLNISGFSGESSDFATMLNNFYQLGLASLAVCGSDKKIIRSAGALLYKQRVEMDIDFCCNYTECRVIKDPNYIIVNFNRDCTYTNGFENDYRPNIYSVFLDGEEKDRNEQLDIKKGSKLVIHFTAPLTDFSNFFSSQYDSNVKNIISMDFSNFNSSLINKFTSAFKGCTSLKSLDLSSFKVTSETVISNMIEDCSSLVSVDISNFDLTNKEINKIFKNIGKLQYVSLINCLGETNDIYTFLNNIKGLNNEKKFLCINDTKFNDVDSQYKESNNGDSIENVFERCCYFDIENAACKYLLVSFNNECSYESGFENVCRANIDKIILDDAKKSKNDRLEIKAGSKMKIYFNKAPTNFSNFFDVQYDANVANIDSIDFSHMDLTKVIDMGYLFKGCSSLESITFSKATPTAIKNMAGMLSDCTGIKSIDLSNFIIPGGANMFPMFLGCNNLVAFDLPKIYNFLNGQFLLQLYNQIPPPMGPTSSQPTLKYMNLCSLSGLNFEGIANSIGLFFLTNTGTEKVFICLNEQDFSAFLTSFEIVGNKNPYPFLPFELPKPNITFERCCDFNLETSECELPPTSNNDSDLIDSDNYIVVYFNGNIDYSNFMNRYRTGVAGIVANGKKLNIEDSFTIQSGISLQIHFNETVVSLEHFFDSITDENAASISSIDFSHFDSSKLSNMNSIFSGCFDLVTVDFTNFNWTNIQDIGYMFYGCDSFKSIDLSNADISKITNMERVFQSCDSLESVIFPESGPQNVENIDYMFYYCSALKSVDLSKFNLSKITDMYGMFDGCYSLESVAFPESTQNVEDMGSMFSGCSKLKSIDLSKSNLSKVTNMEGMFEDCETLESVAFPVSGPQNIEDMSNIFYGCSALKSMNFSNFDLAKVTNMDNMFQSCSKLESVILPESSPQNLQSMSNIINGCSSLTSIDFSMIKLLESTKIESFIAACDSLVEIDFPILDLKTYNFSEKFGPIQGGLHLKYINLLGTTGTNENFADLFKQLYNNYNLTSLSVCVNDEEIIESAQSILSGTNKVDMELKYCCNYPICKIIETTNMPSTSYLENIEIMTTTEFYINKPQSSFVDEIEPLSSSGLFQETKTTDYEESTSINDNIELNSTNLDIIEPTTFNNDIGQIESTSIQKEEPKSTHYEEEEESQSSYIGYILEKSTIQEEGAIVSTNIPKEEPKITTTEIVETKDSETEELQPKSSNMEVTPKSTIIEEEESQSSYIDYISEKSTIQEKGAIVSTNIPKEEPKITTTEIVETKDSETEELQPKSSNMEEKPKSTHYEEEEESQSSYIDYISEKSTIQEEGATVSTNIPKEEPKITTTEIVEAKDSETEELQPKSSNVEVKPKSTIIEENKPSTNLEEIQKETKGNIEPKTTNVVQPKTTNLPDIETKSTTMKEIKIETTIVEEVQINTTNIADIEIKSTTIKEIQIESTIREEKETEIEKERQPEEEKQPEENQTEDEHQKEKEESETQKETDKAEEETQKEEEPEIEEHSEKELDKKEQQKEEKEKEPEEEKEQKTEKEQESKPEKTSEKEKETVKETSKDEKTYAPTNIPTTVQPETEKQEETDKKEDTPKNITLSYRQINNFEQNDTSKIEFDLYTLTMEEELLKGFKIPIYVNLIHTNGTRDEEPTEAICILNHDIKGNTASSLAYFRCSIENLEEIYYSFRYNYSDYIIGVPNDEIALDPILTKKSIKKNEIVDSSDESNLPPTFVFGSMIHENCKDNGVLIFLGKISKTIDDPIVFTLSLLNPEGTSLYCNLNGNEGKLECKTDRQIEDKTIRIAQTIIKEGIKEVLLLGSFMPEDQVTCANAIYKESTEKSSITVSFRQVSHFEKKSNGFSFYFTSLLSKEYKKGYNLILKMDVEINGKYTEKNANCILNDDAYPAAGAVVQGNFLCSVDLSPSEYTNTNFTTIRVSQANDKIGGISNLDKITENPYKTDLAIKEIKEKRAKNEYISEYADIVDYLEEEVKINPIFNIDYIKDSDTCGETGKFILVGATTDDITEDFKFDLPLTYPNDILKCEMIASKKNDKIEITCKSTFGFKDVQNIIFEQRLITKKNKELVIIPNKQINLDQMINCVDYNSAKIQLVKQRSNSGLFFLQVSKFAPLLNSFKFFIALTKRETKVPFKKTHELPIKLKFSSKMFLRNLEEVLSGVKAKCDINNELQTDYAAGYDCANSDSFSGTPQSMEIETAKIEDIGGIPESANPDKLNYNIDYSLLQNLKTIDDLPTVEIQNINADTCSENGEFNMTAILNKNGNLKSIYSDVRITFSVPETRGLCEIIIKDKNMSMTCQNEENFYITQIFIERQSVQDSEGNEIFFIESFINPEQFACDISLNLATKTKNTNLENDTTLTDTSTDGPVKNSISRRAMFRNNNSGMSGGAIAAIVISLVVAIAVVAFLISLNLKKRKNKIHEVGESSILGFVAKGKENSINKM